MLAITPLRIYNTSEKHWRQHSSHRPRRLPIIVKAASYTKKDEAEVKVAKVPSLLAHSAIEPLAFKT